MSAVSFNLGNYNRAMSEHSRRTTNSIGSFYGKSPTNARVTTNNVRGKPVDKLTAEQLKPETDPHQTTYNGDYAKKSTKERLEPLRSHRHANFEDNDSNYAQPKHAATTKNAGINGQAQIQLRNQGNQREEVEQKSEQSHNIKQHVVNQDTAKNHSHICSGSEVGHKHATRSNFDAQSIRDEMRRAFLSNPNVKIDDEAEYYETVRRLDVCGGCWTGQQKYYSNPFKLKHKSPGNTIYQKDYVKHPLDGKGPVLNNDFYTTFHADEPMDFGTTMKNDYKPWNVNAPKRANGENKASASGIPFGGRSGYKGDYINWGNLPVNIEKAPNTISVIKELPFVSKTSYGDNFGNQGANEPVKPFNRKNQKNPLSPSIPFLGETTHNKTFKPFKVGGAPLFLNRDDYEPTEAYPNQYKSLYNEDYEAPPKWKCPAKIFMETHTHPRQKYFKS